MIWHRLIVFIKLCLLLTVSAASQDLFPKQIVLGKDTIIAITIKQMDAISGELIRAKELPALHSLLDAQNGEIQSCLRLVKTDAILIDTLNVQISNYMRLTQSQEHEKGLLAGIIKQQSKSIRRVKLMTSIIAIPVSLSIGTILGLIIGR